MNIRVRWFVPKPAQVRIHNENTSGDKDETQYFYRDIWLGSIVRKRSEFAGAGKESANAHRRLFMRQLSVQHSEGRGPSRLRTETQGDPGNRLSERLRNFYA